MKRFIIAAIAAIASLAALFILGGLTGCVTAIEALRDPPTLEQIRANYGDNLVEAREDITEEIERARRRLETADPFEAQLLQNTIAEGLRMIEHIDAEILRNEVDQRADCPGCNKIRMAGAAQ